MGVFYYIRAVALLEDLPLESEGGHHNIEGFIATVEAGYTQVSHILSHKLILGMSADSEYYIMMFSLLTMLHYGFSPLKTCARKTPCSTEIFI